MRPIQVLLLACTGCAPLARDVHTTGPEAPMTAPATRSLPPLDLRSPDHLETATFALG